jgi:hypothetical protein
VIYHGVGSFIGEQNLATWCIALDLLESRPYHTVLPGHGLPGDRQLYAAAKAYLATAAEFAAAAGPGDLNRRLAAAYPPSAAEGCMDCKAFTCIPPIAPTEG